MHDMGAIFDVGAVLPQDDLGWALCSSVVVFKPRVHGAARDSGQCTAMLTMHAKKQCATWGNRAGARLQL